MSLIKAEGICKKCFGDFSLKDISFEIEEKGIYGFLGSRGAGNSSLAKILAGAWDIDAGHLFYNDKEMYLRDKQNVLIKSRIGYVSDKPLFDEKSTAFEILDFIGKAKSIDPDKRYRQIKEALAITGLMHKSEILVSDLQLNERKRLAIAASLLGNPEVIIWDEPLRYLDAKQAEEIKKLLAMLKNKKVVLIFSSSPAEIEELCDTVGILSCGELVLWKSKEELIATLEENRLGGLSDVLEAFNCKGAE